MSQIQTSRPSRPGHRVPSGQRATVAAINLLLALSIAALPACGGGGSDPQDSAQDPAAADAAVDSADAVAPTAEELAAAAAAARSEGNLELADDLAQLARDPSGATAESGSTSKSIWSKVAKTVLIKALRHGGSTLGKLLAKKSPKFGNAVIRNANKIADMLDNLQSMQEIPIIVALVHMGIEPSLAREIARWIVIFVGL